MTSDVHAQQAKDRIAVNVAAALLVAGLILVGAVLPAEYGVDPLGVGRRLGLLAMGDAKQELVAYQQTRATGATGEGGGAPTLAPQPRGYQNEAVEFRLAAGESVEYKYRLDKGEALLYSWSASSEVPYELHAEPDGAPRGYAESFEKAEASAAAGTLVAPFSGIHGWYWENPTDHDVTVRLSAAGFYNMSHEFRKDRPPKTKMFP